MLNKEELLFAEWRKGIDNFAKDGVVNSKLYLKSKYKILFILKETNGTEDDFDLRKYLASGARPQTWSNITRWVMGINDYNLKWSKLSDINQKLRIKHLSSIAAINMKKMPGGHTTNTGEFWDFIVKDKIYIKRQINIYKADIIILCGSIVADAFRFIHDGALDNKWQETSRGISFVEYTEGKFAIAYAHPEARVQDCLLHYGIIDAVKEILPNYLS